MNNNLEIYWTIEKYHISDKIKSEIQEICDLYAQKCGYKLIKFKKYDSYKYYSELAKDTVKKGICVLDEMLKYLKFKTNNNIWFLYIATGNIFDNNGNYIKGDVFLLNRDVNKQKCHYFIKEHVYNIYFKEYLMNLFHSTHYLNYDKVFTETLEFKK